MEYIADRPLNFGHKCDALMFTVKNIFGTTLFAQKYGIMYVVW